MRTQSRDTTPSLRRRSSKHARRSWPKSTRFIQVLKCKPSSQQTAIQYILPHRCRSGGPCISIIIESNKPWLENINKMSKTPICQDLVSSCHIMTTSNRIWLHLSDHKNVLSPSTEKLAEAQRRFATLQNELQSSLDAQRESSRAPGLRPRRRAVFHLSQQERCKHRNIKDLQLAFSEFYLSLILLQNYQVSIFQYSTALSVVIS